MNKKLQRILKDNGFVMSEHSAIRGFPAGNLEFQITDEEAYCFRITRKDADGFMMWKTDFTHPPLEILEAVINKALEL